MRGLQWQAALLGSVSIEFSGFNVYRTALPLGLQSDVGGCVYEWGGDGLCRAAVQRTRGAAAAVYVL